MGKSSTAVKKSAKNAAKRAKGKATTAPSKAKVSRRANATSKPAILAKSRVKTPAKFKAKVKAKTKESKPEAAAVLASVGKKEASVIPLRRPRIAKKEARVQAKADNKSKNRRQERKSFVSDTDVAGLRQKTFGSFLNEARTKLGFTQKQLAEELHYSTAQFISNWERGASQPPYSVLSKLAKALNVKAKTLIDKLFEGEMDLLKLQKDAALRLVG